MKLTRSIVAFIMAAITAFAFLSVRVDPMTVVKVDIGKNIEEIAKQRGAPRYEIESHWGLEIYELVDLKPEVKIVLNRSG